jgi:hypothetical protein
MKTFILTSELFSGDIEFRYNDAGFLTGFDNRSGFNDSQHQWLLRYFPTTVPAIEKMGSLIKGQIKELKVELTFDMFWQRYFTGRDKDNSSKKRSETKWNRMNKSDQAKAYQYIYTYMSRIPYGTRPKYAETYLNSELWNA